MAMNPAAWPDDAVVFVLVESLVSLVELSNKSKSWLHTSSTCTEGGEDDVHDRQKPFGWLQHWL